ncbi:MAG: PaaI family thioesterase [Saprospiraceae bacterium]
MAELNTRGSSKPPPLPKAASAYLSHLQSPWKLWLYFIKNLPSALWWGLRIEQVNERESRIVIPYNWRTKNPFRSIYFAALAGAGELSTGVLASMARLGQGDISMLVLEQRAEFFKKASSTITFTCTQGAEVQETVQRAIDTLEAQTITMLGTGRNMSGEIVCKIFITWTFKVRTPKK